MTKRIVCLLIILLLILTSCWDQRLLKDHKLILTIGYDLGQNGTIVKTVTFPQEITNDPQQNLGSNKSEVITTIGDTVKDAENKMDQYIPERFDRSKSEVVFFGKRIANNGIFSTLDSLYRDLRGPLNATVAIIDETAEEALNLKQTYNLLTSGFYSKLLKSADESGIIKIENVQSICPIILTDGADIFLPYLKIKNDQSEAEITGLALFSDDIMTGSLNLKESTMLLILTGKAPKRTKLNLKVLNDNQKHDKNFVDFSIRKLKRKIDINTTNNQVEAKVKVKLDIEIDEFSSDHLNNEQRAKYLTKQIDKKLTKLAKETIEKIQKANNDSIQIGQQVKAYHNEVWKNINWKEVYPDIPIDVKFDIKIIRHGIIN